MSSVKYQCGPLGLEILVINFNFLRIMTRNLERVGSLGGISRVASVLILRICFIFGHLESAKITQRGTRDSNCSSNNERGVIA